MPHLFEEQRDIRNALEDFNKLVRSGGSFHPFERKGDNWSIKSVQDSEGYVDLEVRVRSSLRAKIVDMLEYYGWQVTQQGSSLAAYWIAR